MSSATERGVDSEAAPTIVCDGIPTLETADSGAELAAGTRVGDYVIEHKIGAGGCGTVYLARHPLIGKRAAVKVIAAAGTANPVHADRLLLEARSVNEVGHRNLVDIFAFGRLPDGRPYLVMEYLEGEDLGQRLQRMGRLTLAEVVPIISQLARGLSAAHAKGFVHRDLKPENVFIVQEDGRPFVKLLDFGLAKLTGPTASHRTRSGVIMGTPQYMSPEQARGQDVDHRTDIYSLGVILYECLTGKPPFQAPSDVEILILHISTAAEQPSRRAPLPSGVDTVVMRCLEKAADRRYGSAADVAAGLETVLAEGLTAQPGARIAPASDRDGPTRTLIVPIVPSVDPGAKTSLPDPVWHDQPAIISGRRSLRAPLLAGAVVVGALVVVGWTVGWPPESSLPDPRAASQSAGAAGATARSIQPAASNAPEATSEVLVPDTGQVVVGVAARGAAISLDGVAIPVRDGKALATDLRAGSTHVVRVVAPGFRIYESVVRVEGGHTVRVVPNLVRRSGPSSGRNLDDIVVPWE